MTERSELEDAYEKYDTQRHKDMKPIPKGKTARFITIGRHKPRITREHIHSIVKITVDFCPDCGKVVGGGEQKR